MRRTLLRPAILSGVGLFTAARCSVRLGPGAPGSGWWWRTAHRWHRLAPDQLRPLPRRSRLVADSDSLLLPEHLLAALVLADVDDVTIDVRGGEVPLLDGSARPFAQALLHAGLDAPRSRLTVTVVWGGTSVSWTGGFAPALARTFIDADTARASRALFPGARPGVALVIDDGARLLGARGRRLPNEPAWHKLLDLLGDLGPFRAMGPLHGALCADQPSHDRNPALIRAALATGAIRHPRTLAA